MALCVPGVLAGTDEPDFIKSKHPSQKVVDQEFSLKAGGQLRIDVDDIDVYVKKSDGAKSRVQVFVAGSNEEKALEYFEEHSGFELEEDNNELVMSSTGPSSFWGSSWHKHRNVRIWAVVSVPSRFDADISVEDGDLRVDDLDGDITIRSADGDIETRDLRGPSITIKTSDGDILAKSLEAKDEIVVSTSDGDIDGGRLYAKRVSVSTSDGDISIEHLEGDDIKLRSSDGDMEVGVAGGKLRADCSDGDIDIKLLDAVAIDLKSRDGDIDIVIPQALNLDINLEGDNVSVRGGNLTNGNVSRRGVEGSLNNGGPLVRAKSNDGRIVLKLQ
jgi:FlaG/FlaF family flagellin (archaellin)